MFRISPSLLDSFGYYLSIEDTEKSAQSRQEIIDGLNGIKVTNEAMQAGTDFENAVVKAVQFNFVPTDDKMYDACVVECADEVRGSIYQYHVEKEFCGVLIHGVIDFLRANRIIDTKTTSKYEIGKYRDKNQHLIYLSCLQDEGVDRFTYLVTDFKNVYKEDYFWNPKMLDTLKANIHEFLDYLENDAEMKQAFIAKDHNKQTWKNAELLKG